MIMLFIQVPSLSEPSQWRSKIPESCLLKHLLTLQRFTLPHVNIAFWFLYSYTNCSLLMFRQAPLKCQVCSVRSLCPFERVFHASAQPWSGSNATRDNPQHQTHRGGKMFHLHHTHQLQLKVTGGFSPSRFALLRSKLPWKNSKTKEFLKKQQQKVQSYALWGHTWRTGSDQCRIPGRVGHVQQTTEFFVWNKPLSKERMKDGKHSVSE